MSLSLDDILSIQKATNKKKRVSRNNEERWPDEYKDEIRAAIQHDADEIFIGGRWFDITYRGTKFRLKPREGLVPMGWFDRKW